MAVQQNNNNHISFATLAGFLGGIGLCVGSVVMSTNNYMVFLDMPSFLMVIGGTLAVAFISFEPKYVLGSLQDVMSILFAHREGQAILKNEVGRIIRWGYVVQKNGLKGLEADATVTVKNDTFMLFGIDLVTAGYTGDEIKKILESASESAYKRAHMRSDVLKMMAGTSPAFGMIGTLVGLIIMLGNLNDPSAIGPGMAVALITTLYGILAARLLFLPAATKVNQREDIVLFRNILIAEGLSMLAERKSPRYIQDRMNAYISPGEHFLIDRDLQRKDRTGAPAGSPEAQAQAQTQSQPAISPEASGSNGESTP